MKKILMIIVGSFFCLSAIAKKPLSIATHRKVVKDIMNFKVCKNDAGYTICGQVPSAQNSTYALPVYRPAYNPAYEPDRGVIIVLPGIMEIPKVKFPYDQPGPTAESGAFIGINSWNGGGMW